MAGTVGKGVLLLKDTQGDKSASLLTGFRKKKDVPVLRGSLLIAISPKDAPSGADGKPAHNYGVHLEDITLYCSEYVIAPLTNYEFKLLSGISALGARYDAFISDNHEWGSNLRVGDTVYVALPTKDAIANTGCQAVVRWIGTLRGVTGITFGIEITEEKYRGSGFTNGFFQYNRYFICDDNCGMFVSLERLATTPNYQPTKTPNAQTTKPTIPNQVLTRLGLKTKNEGTGDRANTSQGLAAGTRSSQVHKNSGFRFKKGDRVTTHNKDQILIHGTVRWTGETNTDSGKVNAVGIETDISVQKKEFLIAFTGLSSNFRCENSKHGKVVVPEELVRTEMEEVEEKRSRQEELAHQHEGTHMDPSEKDMLRDTNIESVALNPAEQDRMIQMYKQGIDENQQQGSIRRPNVPANSHLHVHRALSQDTRSTGINPDHEASRSNSQRPNDHVYTLPISSLGHHSARGNILSRQDSQPGNIQSGEEAMLRKADVKTWEMQDERLKEFNKQRDEKRQMEAARAGNPSSSCVDPPDSHHSENHLPRIYGNMPGADYKQPAVMALPSSSHDSTKHQFVMGSRVAFSDPPRYGEIRWMGNFPQVSVLIAGLQLEEDMEGCTDGTWQGKRCFSCKYGRAFFSPVTALHPDQRGSAPSQFSGNTPPIQRELPPLPRPAAPVDVSKGSTVQFGDSRNPWHGIVRWVGNLPGEQELLAGIELEEYADRCGDGELNGVRYFQCEYGKGTFYPVARLQPDQKFADSAPAQAGNPLQVAFEEGVDQPVPPPLYYVGDQKGIQGNQNSCYLDSSLFGLFALSDIFDEMFLSVAQSTTADINRQAISDMLWKGIVNPLRKYGVVRFESVMTMKNKMDELGKMEGITEKEKDPEEFLNMLFKHMLRVPAFISIRRPFGVEQEFFVPLFVELDPNLRLPTVGVLITMMFKEQNISFTKIPSKLLVQVPQFGREFKTYMYQKIVPDMKLNIAEITDSGKTPPCCFCGELSQYKCSECVNELQRHDVSGYVYYCATCCPLAHKKDERKQHKPEPALNNNNELYKLDLLSVICIETSHYVCFTRDLNTDTWLFFDSMANRVYDTYNIPRVTDCTRELNEWVYEGDQDRLINTPPRELPELVRRFTHNVNMCVYVQPDVAMYGPPDMYGDDSQIYSSSVVPTVPKLMESKDDIVEELKQEITSLQAENKSLQQKIETNQAEQSQHIQLLEAEKQQLLQQYSEREHTTSQEMAEKEEQIQHQKREKQQSDNEKLQLERQKQHHEAQSQRYQQQAQDMQRRLEVAESKTNQSKFSKLQIPQLDQDSWNVRRQEVVLQDNLGHGAWGSVCRGFFRGQQVAVKCAHKEILHENTIDQLKREIRIMSHVQHPNLVRLIAAVVDAGVERCTDSPLLVLELLDTDVRSAYNRKIVTFKKDTSLSIFREVAYALHYLHEHQEPIIHRDVSAPNVLLQQIHPGVWKAKLSDFGSANLAKSCKTAAPGAIVYAAPETFPPSNLDDPLPKQTTKIDVYSYGYLLAEAIAKEMPSRENRRAMLLRIKSEWEQVYDIIAACVESQPDNRLTMTQVLEKLNMLPSQ